MGFLIPSREAESSNAEDAAQSDVDQAVASEPEEGEGSDASGDVDDVLKEFDEKMKLWMDLHVPGIFSNLIEIKHQAPHSVPFSLAGIIVVILTNSHVCVCRVWGGRVLQRGAGVVEGGQGGRPARRRQTPPAFSSINI